MTAGDGTTWTALLADAWSGAGVDRTAVISGTTVWSGADLLRHAAGAADWLDSLAIATGTRLPALVSTTPDALALTIAGAATRRPLAPLSTRLTVHELTACLSGLAGDLLLVEPGAQELGRELEAATGRRAVVHPAIPLSDRPLVGAADTDPPGREDTAFILHTSGTSGVPKAVVVAQGKLAVRTRVNAASVGLAPGGVYASGSPYHHIAGLGMIAVALGAGASVVCVPPFSPANWQDLGGRGTTHALLVPTMIDRLLAEGALALPTLRVLQYGASPIHPDTLREAMAVLPGVDFVQIFGQTEGSPITCLSFEDHRLAATTRPDLLRTVGRAADGVELKVVNPGADGSGEIWARGEHLFRPEADGWLRTGDLGRIDSDGYVTLLGRNGDRIVRGGENVDPLEVEQVLSQHPEVSEVAVVGRADRRWGQVVKAFIVPANPDAPPDAEDLRGFARAALSGFKVPSEWEMIESLPRSQAGKVLRRMLAS
ncbi:class I adenylate-forming enzyme family protein [Frankia sp. Cppng1_Ct_nod]|uniref:class I adenylate-forming enzyme family protein n=1 Tax=Frankia sp. Cppng1_Ct_nod TaxID=2897162 RepID=UPI001041AB1E|nr:class I adenylate-forming enzyme family protein [Frankia sp. Cppng1_Ct_nod]